MKRLLILMFLVIMPAVAQTPPPVVQALDTLLHQAVEREARIMIEAISLQAQVEELKKECDALKKSAAEDKSKKVP